MVPRPVVTLVVLVLVAILAADIGGQLWIDGHTASPVIDGAIIALIGAIITGTKGPKPEDPEPPGAPAPAPAPVPPSTPVPAPVTPAPGRHHRSEDPS